MGTYKDLDAWKKARMLCKAIYQATESMPETENYGLISQMRRAVISIASNMAEGYGRDSAKDYIRFLRIACGSSYELETQIILSHDLGYFTKEQAVELYKRNTVVLKLIRGLIRSLSERQGISLKEERSTYGSEENVLHALF